MAKRIPDALPSEILNEPFRQAEIEFFNASISLPDDWFVLYGVSWYLRIKNNTWNEGEADFVLVSPDIGLVVVEIKGGRIGRDENGWYSVDRNDIKHKIKDPSNQAANCKHKLLRFIKADPRFHDRDIPARHMVCFPNVSIKDFPSLIEIPREMQILNEDFKILQEKIESFAQRNYTSIGTSNVKLSFNECREIVKILKPNFDCPERWSTLAIKQNKIINDLTEEQAYLWDIIEDNNRVSLSGPAGSGKTVLALKLIQAEIQKGNAVLALLPSYALQKYYSAVISNKLLTTYSYHCCDGTNDDKHYSLIIVDEAQDITEDGWLCLYESYNISSATRFLCIFDSNQKLNTQGQYCPLEDLIPLKLTKVLRNTNQIGSFASMFYSGEKNIKIIGPNGVNVQFTKANDAEAVVQTVIELIENYVFNKGFDFSDIVVLFADNKKSAIKKMLNLENALGVSFRGIRAYMDSYAHKSPIVTCESVYVYRGLESKVVLLTGLDNITESQRDSASYIGASRAKNVLHIIANSKTIKSLKQNTR